MRKKATLNLTGFFPSEIKITGTEDHGEEIVICMKSHSQMAVCPECGGVSTEYHSTYRRNIRDVPLLGKRVVLSISAYKYNCRHEGCGQKVFSEELEGFAGKYRRYTERCEALIATLGVNMSCEAAARVCGIIGVPVSNDTVKRFLIKWANGITPQECGECIGVDDWAKRKGQSYGTIICDGITRKPIELLEGRDGKTLREWLDAHRQVKVVTRDRAGAYARAIKDVLPHAIQVADRFHLYNNLMVAIKDTLKAELPNEIRLEEGCADSDTTNADHEDDGEVSVKKTGRAGEMHKKRQPKPAEGRD